ncbi:TRAP transporter large permease [Anaerobium acetethylicum]|uniref:TRAP transporter, DctM subunit n=1 Tax=Anaerobium acetethylicum TaxID=1619234 RepID=A0A1D3TYE4_9FIRM|nr:TRAP transporter large permease [Anaerobium acetethylicum]SCP99442.1 TRAP transporter, DctM subunit [Anaerobium acetethylicum]
MGVLLVIMFIVFVAIGVPISFALGVVSFVGIAGLPEIPNAVVFTKMFNGMNSFTLLAVPLFILAANLMNEGSITEKLIKTCNSMVGHKRGGLAYSNVLVSMIFAGISGSSQADTAGVGKIFIPSMEAQGYDKGTSVGVTAASSTLGSIIPPSITMVVYAGIANVATGALFMTGLIPGILLGIGMMLVVKYYAVRKNFPKSEKVPFKEVLKLTFQSLPALFTPILLIGGIVSGVFTPTESAAFACVYALLVGIFFYKTIKIKALPGIIIETLKLSSLSLFALATANALGELLSYYQLNIYVQEFFTSLSGGKTVFLLVIVAFFMFIGTFMDAVPAMILFVPIILPSSTALGISPIILGLIIVVTLALGLVTPPYGLCLLIASSISGITIEDAFKGTLPYFLSSIAILLVMVLFPDLWLSIPAFLFPALF